jgi:hypothetical protein
MKSIGKKISASLFVLALFSAAQLVMAMTTEAPASSSVSKIALTDNGGGKISWQTTGSSAQGFKVVWSRNDSPTYPTRSGDQYHYYAEPSKSSDTVDAFAGAGAYFVRVCEYLGGRCGLYSNEIKISLGTADESQVACTMEYAPVCGEQIVYCIKAPCPPIKTTFGNKCQLNAAKAKYLYSGECKKTEVKKPTTEEVLKARVAQLEARVKKLEKENKRLYSLIKLREAKIKALKEALRD